VPLSLSGGAGNGEWLWAVGDSSATSVKGLKWSAAGSLTQGIGTYNFWVRKLGDTYYEQSNIAGPYQLTVTWPKPLITLTAASGSKYYDGAPLSLAGPKLTAGTLTAGHVLSAPPSESYGPDAGTYSVGVGSVRVLDSAGTDVTTAYTITLIPGVARILKATPAALAISPAAAHVVVGKTVSFSVTGGSGTGAIAWAGCAQGTGSALSVQFPEAGTYTLTAQQAADANYNAGAPVSATIIAAAPTFTLATAAYGPGTVTEGGTYSPNQGVTLYATPTAPNGRFLSWTGDTQGCASSPLSAGRYSLYVPITSDRNIYANFAAKLPQTLTATTPLAHDLNAGPLFVVASASSGLSPVFSVVSGPGHFEGNALYFEEVGDVVVQIGQPGDDTYLPADTLTRSISAFSAPKVSIEGSGNKVQDGRNQPANFVPGN